METLSEFFFHMKCFNLSRIGVQLFSRERIPAVGVAAALLVALYRGWRENVFTSQY
jgi:hypothetical protein